MLHIYKYTQEMNFSVVYSFVYKTWMEVGQKDDCHSNTLHSLSFQTMGLLWLGEFLASIK